ncbi:MAG TPA: ferritin [Spirillospora sp.]|nr:ferritin [Spirillospora sp.]
MLTAKTQQALNDQLNAELQAYYTYLSMSAYFEDQNLKGFAAWMRNHSNEEMMHAMKIYDFINERRGRVQLQTIPQPRIEWESALEAFEDALKHEQHVTHLINQLVELSMQENDYATHSFLQWFVDEQVEEEAVVDDVIQDLRRVGDYGPGLFLLDRELGGGQAQPGSALA